jgi:hypothetical protein
MHHSLALVFDWPPKMPIFFYCLAAQGANTLSIRAVMCSCLQLISCVKLISVIFFFFIMQQLLCSLQMNINLLLPLVNPSAARDGRLSEDEELKGCEAGLLGV